MQSLHVPTLILGHSMVKAEREKMSLIWWDTQEKPACPSSSCGVLRLQQWAPPLSDCPEPT